MERGRIYLCDLGEPRGSVPGFVRPVVVVQDDRMNSSRIATTMVLPLTSNVQYKDHPGCVLLKKSETGLSKDSVANASQLSVVDKAQLQDEVGVVPDHLMHSVDECMRMMLSL